MIKHTIIPARFNGPPTTGNGGYSCGVLGTLLGASAEVTLRKPPPLDRELRAEVDGDQQSARLYDGELLIGSARVAEPDVSVPPPPSYHDAQAAEAHYAHAGHYYPTCFVCGPARAVGDGLRLFTGKVDGRDVVASAWIPSHDLADADGKVDPKVVWSALDCPSYFAGRMAGYGVYALLGRLTASLMQPVRAGERYIAMGWPIGKEGRKWEGGTAVYTADGQLCAFARGLWVEVQVPA